MIVAVVVPIGACIGNGCADRRLPVQQANSKQHFVPRPLPSRNFP